MQPLIGGRWAAICITTISKGKKQVRYNKGREPTILERLEIFIKRANSLQSRRLIEVLPTWAVNIKFERDSGLQFQLPPVDEDDLQSFLLSFRHFIAKKEPAFINRIFNDCIRFLADTDSVDKVKRLMFRTSAVVQYEAWTFQLQT